jgi:hypothetical protein
LGGHIITGLLIGPLALTALAAITAPAGARLHATVSEAFVTR